MISSRVERAGPKTPPGQLQSLHRSLDVLELLSNETTPMRLTEISNCLGLAKTKVFRILATLTARGFVRKDPRNHYYSLDIGVWRLARSVNDISQLVDFVKPFIDNLCETTQATAFLSTLHKESIIYLYSRTGPSPSLYLEIGSYLPLHATGSGKALLAHQSREYINKYLDNDLEEFTEFTITNRDTLITELENIRQRGYSIERDEWGIGFSGVATVIPTFGKEQYAAIGLFFLTNRADDPVLQELIDILLGTRQKIMERLSISDRFQEAI
jgi:DNA-binding IclR family transcriptional regulator